MIIVDDGSNDNTEDFINNNFLFNNKIKYYKRPHKGLAFSRNFGIKNAVGSFITFLDSDDELKNNHIELRVDYLNENPEIDLIYGGVEIIGPPEAHYVKDKNDLTKLIHLNECVIGATIFAKRKVFELLNGFNNIYSEDSDFVERAEKIFKVKKIDFATYIYYRDIPDSICNNI